MRQPLPTVRLLALQGARLTSCAVCRAPLLAGRIPASGIVPGQTIVGSPETKPAVLPSGLVPGAPFERSLGRRRGAAHAYEQARLNAADRLRLPLQLSFVHGTRHTMPLERLLVAPASLSCFTACS